MRVHLGRAIAAAALVAAVTLTASFVPVNAQASPCPPGQPPGRPPGVPPGPPQNVPPSGRGQYPPGACNLALSQAAAQRGQPVGVSGEGFVAGDQVVLRLDPGSHVLGTASADGSGAFRHTITVPHAATLGANTVVATGAGRELTASLEVLAAGASRASAASTAPGSLPRTGGSVAAMVVAGAGLVAVGSAVVVAARRRRVLV